MNKRIFLGILAVLAGFSAAQAEKPPVKVFVFAGQSNLPRDMFGADVPDALESWINTSPQNDCLYFFDGQAGVSTNWEALDGHGASKTQFGAEHFFAYYLVPYFKAINPDQRLAFIQVQRSATSIVGNWNAGGRVNRPTGSGTPAIEENVHIVLRTAVTNALALLPAQLDPGQAYELAGLIWNQGEGDMVSDNGSIGYATRFRDLIGEWVNDPAFPNDSTNSYTGGFRCGFIDPVSRAQTAAHPEMFILTTRTPLLQAETKPWGDASYYDGPIGSLRVRDSLTDGNEAGGNIPGIAKATTHAWWVSCDEFSLRDSYHLEQADRSKMSQKYAAVYVSDILGRGYDAVNFWPSLLTDEAFEKVVTDPYVGSPTYNQDIPALFGSAAAANAHTRRYPEPNASGYPTNTQATKVWWTGTDQRWTKTNPSNISATHYAVFNGTDTGRLAQVICDSHWSKKALKLSFNVKSLDADGLPNGLNVALYGVTSEGRLDYSDPAQPTGQYLPADFAVALDSTAANRNVTLLANRTVLNSASGQPNQLTDWTNVTLTADVAQTNGYSFFVLVFEGDNVQTNSGDFLGVDDVVLTPAEKTLPQVELSATAVQVAEGSTADFDIRLTLMPTNSTPVTVTVARVSGDTDITVSGGGTRVFTTNNWSAWQTVTLAAAQDADYVNGSATIRCSSPEMFSLDVAATEADDETDPAYTLPWQETFENDGTNAGTVGALSGQHGWTASNTTVTAAQAQSGSQSAQIGSGRISHTFIGGHTNVQMTLWIKAVAGSAPSAGVIPADASAVFYISTNGYVTAYSHATPVTLGATVSNGWNKVEIENNYVSKVWKLSLNGATLFTNFAFYSSGLTGLAELRVVNGSSVSNTFVDSIALSDLSDPSDTDADGLPDAWEVQYFGGTSISPDDMASNGINTVLQAYIAGLDPTDPDARFLIADLRPLSSVSILQWQNASGRVYTVYWTSNLLSGFQSLKTNVIGGAFTDTLHSAEDKGFYKIDVRVP